MRFPRGEVFGRMKRERAAHSEARRGKGRRKGGGGSSVLGLHQEFTERGTEVDGETEDLTWDSTTVPRLAK